MVMSERSTVIGVFTDDQYANLAADELRRVGFCDDEMSVSRHKDEEGSSDHYTRRERYLCSRFVYTVAGI